MPTATKNYGDISIYSSYIARTAPSGTKTISTYPIFVSSTSYSCTFADLNIPDGSTINSASVTFTAGDPLHGDGGKKLTISGNLYETVTSGMSVSYNQGSFVLQFKSGTSGTTYAAPDPDNYTYKTNASTYKFGSFTLNVSYTLPYTACTAPSSVSTPTNVLPSSSQTLSWSGASAGTNNAITGYQVYRASTSNGTYTALGSKIDTSATSGSLAVTANSTNGSSYYYKVATIGTVAGYDSGQSTSIATMTSTVGNVTAPTANSVSSTNKAPSTSVTLSWSGAAAGTNNAITGYQVYYATTSSGTYSTYGSKVTTSATSGSTTVTSPATPNTSYFFKVKTIGTVSGYDSTAYSPIAELKTTVTDVVSPTTVTTPTTAAPSTSATLSWSGAAAGTNNAITGYEVYRATSSGGTYTLLGSKINSTSTSGSTSVTSHSTPNSAYYYKVKTIGTISGYDADNPSTVYASLTSQVTACTIPTSFSSTPSLYEGTLTISWSGQAAGISNPITSYNIEYQISSDNSTWGTATSTTSATDSKAIDTSAITEGYYLRFRVQSIGTISGYDSGWSAYSTSYRKNRIPLTPTITYPIAGSTTYTTTPYFKVVVAAEPDGQAQALQYKIGAGSYVTATSVLSSGGTKIFQTSALSAGSQTITVRVGDGSGYSAEVSRTITVDTTPFTDATLTTATPIKAIHINEIRTRVSNMLAYYSLPAAAWTDTITVGETPIKAIHMTELQNSLRNCATTAGTSRTFTTIVRNTRIAKAHIEQLRTATTQL